MAYYYATTKKMQKDNPEATPKITENILKKKTPGIPAVPQVAGVTPGVPGVGSPTPKPPVTPGATTTMPTAPMVAALQALAGKIQPQAATQTMGTKQSAISVAAAKPGGDKTEQHLENFLNSMNKEITGKDMYPAVIQAPPWQLPKTYESPGAPQVGSGGSSQLDSLMELYKQALGETGPEAYDAALKTGVKNIMSQLGTAQSKLMSAQGGRGMLGSGATAAGQIELNTAAQAQMNELATALQRQKVEAQLERLNQIGRMYGAIMDDATKRELANQVAKLEQQRIDLAGQEQAFQQQAQVLDTIQAIAYNLNQLGLSDKHARELIDSLLYKASWESPNQWWSALANLIQQQI